MNLFGLLGAAAARYPDGVAVLFGNRQIATWSELHRQALRLAATWAGAPPQSRIVIASGNCPEYIVILFAIWAAGHVAVPVNAKLHPREIAEVCEDVEATGLFLSESLAGLFRDLPPCRAITIGSADWEAALAGDPTDPAANRPDDLAWIFFTSGTTGRAKGAMLSHRALMAMAVAHLADFEDLDTGAALLHAAPMSHGSGLMMLAYVARAARQIVPQSGGFEPEEFARLCQFHGGVGAFMAPTMVHRLRTALPPLPIAGLRQIIYGGGPMYLEEIRKARASFGPVFSQLYGQGEAPMTITGLRNSDFGNASDAVLASVGWPRSGVEVALVDETGRPCGPGVPGEIICRGAAMMSGYWNNPDATRETLRDGWLRTGDIAMCDAAGMYTLIDRSKDVIICGGSNIYPREVEEILLSGPGVLEVAVVGERDEEWGECVAAYVVCGSPLTPRGAEALDAHCIAHIARFKRPKSYRFVAELPKNSYGKVVKRLLADLPGETVRL